MAGTARSGRRWLRRVGIGVGVLAAVVIVAVLVFRWDWLIPLVDARASAALGRPVRIAHLHVGLGRVTTVTVDDVTVADPPGFDDGPPLARIGSLSVQVDVLAYLRRRVLVLPAIDVNAPVIEARALPDGRNNYTFTSGNTSSTGSSSPPPQIGRLTITDGRAHVVIPKLRSDFRITAATQDQSIVADADGTYAGQRLTGHLVGGALLSLRDAGQPYPVDLTVASGPTKVALKGTLRDPLTFGGADLTLDFAGPDMAQLVPLTGIPLPPTPAYHITGRLDYADHRLRFRDFAGTVGNSDLEGTIAVDPGQARPDVNADLTSRRVDLADLGGFIGGAPGRADEKGASAAQRQAVKRAEASAKLLPDTPINIPRLRFADVHLTYKGEHIEGRSIPFDTIAVALDIVDGRITLHPITLGVGTGRIAGTVDLTPQADDAVRADGDIKFEHVDLSRIMAATHVFRGAGTIGGQASIKATGNSLASLLGHGDGALDVSMTGGDLSALLVDLSGLQFGKALLTALQLPEAATVECFIGRFTLHDGAVDTRTLLLDTSEGIINGSGSINLRTERIDYRLRTESKHFSIGSLPAPIVIDGPLKDPSIHPGYAELGVRGGVAAGLGFLAAPLALLPTIQFGVEDDPRCARLIKGRSG